MDVFFQSMTLTKNLVQIKSQLCISLTALLGVSRHLLSYVSKTSAWNFSDVYPAITQHVAKLTCQSSLEDVLLRDLERFTILLYDRNPNSQSTNECRRKLFCQGTMINNITETQAAFSKYILRAFCIAGHVWGQSFATLQTLPPADLWGWKYESNSNSQLAGFAGSITCCARIGNM